MLNLNTPDIDTCKAHAQDLAWPPFASSWLTISSATNDSFEICEWSRAGKAVP